MSNAGDGPDRRGVLVAAVMLCGLCLEGAAKMKMQSIRGYENTRWAVEEDAEVQAEVGLEGEGGMNKLKRGERDYGERSTDMQMV